MLAKNFVYTAVTHGKQLVIVVGQRKALAITVRTSNARQRWAKLNGWLQLNKEIQR